MMSRSPSISGPGSQKSQPRIPSEYRPTLHGNFEFDPYKLNFLFTNDVVQYECSCSQFRRLSLTYLCRHCMKIKCRTCVGHEVDSQYCQHCLEYIPTIDPKFQMNKCASCYQCPSCHHLLSTSIISITPQSKEGQEQQVGEILKKTCQLICEFCRWTSDTFVTEGSRGFNTLSDIDTPNLERINELISCYEAISQREKADKKRRRHHTPGTIGLLKKYGIYNSLSPKLFESLRSRSTLYDKTHASKTSQDVKRDDEPEMDSLPSSKARDHTEIEPLDSDLYYSNKFDPGDISGIEQRLVQIELQPEKVADFMPISKSLSVKHFLRCKECEHALCRSEYSPVSIRFRIQSAAYYHIPELRLKSDTYPINLVMGTGNVIEFTLQNHTLSPIKVNFSQIESETELYELTLPPSDLNLSPKDDTTDYQHIPFNMRPLKKETQVTFQSLFKVGFYILVRPKVRTDFLSIKFTMTYDVLIPQNPRDNDKTEKISNVVQTKLGPVKQPI